MPTKSLFERPKWRTGVAVARPLVAFASIPAAAAWYLGWLEGLGVALSFLLALAAFPLAFLSCVLVRHYRDIGRSIGAFFGHDVESATSGEPSPVHDAANPADALAVPEAYQKTLTQLSTEIERLKGIVKHNSEKVANSDRDVLYLLDVMAWVSGYIIICDLLERRPELTPFVEQKNITVDWLNGQKKEADEYVWRVRRGLSGTHWLGELKRRLVHAANIADSQVQKMSADKVPEGMDRLDLRPYAIAATEYDWTVNFLIQQKDEGRETLSSFGSQLRERTARRR